MAISNNQIIHSLLATFSSTFFLLLLISSKANSQETVSFSFPKFTKNQPNIILQNDSLITSEGKLQLTKVENGKPIWRSVGRALYYAPIRLYDSTTNKVASFATSFDFVIDAPNTTTTADGLAFFLAHPDTTAPNVTGGGYLGLFSNPNYNKSNQVVAVEFDTHENIWDPNNRHMGLDVNSIRSTKTASWGLVNGQTANVVISYDGSTGLLVAYAVYASTETGYILTSKVDLKSALPEWVRIGISATTGATNPASIETHDVTSWSFASTFKGSAADALKEINPYLASHLARDFM
ncbi:hypothetical protein PIB30_032557 [Stylosanthes scabra]|uniref:Legume lectin domain-containing protein n=1 Tax=Stylosanthes scabra TaxID=79078 RepID=A0ABU6QCD2_9FABA|nr:hypothetical protein [Stylosanthes scabra]